MPGKSRHKKGKHAIKGKKAGSAGRSNKPVQRPAVTQGEHHVLPQVVPAPSSKIAVPVGKSDTTHHLYITSELRTIGILASIILIVLILLAQVVG